MATELASLVVRLQAESTQLRADLDRVEQRLDRAAKSAEAFGKRMSQAGEKMTARITLPLAAIGAASIKMASDAEEAANKFNVVMGAAADETRARLEELTETIPLTRAEMEEMAAGIQDMLVPMGVARTEAAGMSADMVQLAGDLASFNNVGTTQVLEAMQSALAGSSEPMRRFGVDTRETRLQALALEQGLISQGEKLDNTTRALAVLAAIQADSTDAMGDAARTVDSTANSFRFLLRDVKELSISIGQILIPMIQPLVAELRDAVEWVKGLSESQRRMVVMMGLAAAAAGPLAMAVGGVTRAVIGLRAATLALQASLGPAGWLLAGLGLAAGGFLALRQQAISAGDSLDEFRAKAALLGREQLSDELAKVNLQLANIGETIKQQGGLDSANEATRTRFQQLLERARILGERLKEVRSVVEDLDEAWAPVADVADQVVDSVNAQVDGATKFADELERAVAAYIGMDRYRDAQRRSEERMRERRLMGPTAGFFDLGFDLPDLQIPETIEAITESAGELKDEGEGLKVSLNQVATTIAQNASPALDGLERAIIDVGQALVAGGVAGGVVAGLGMLTAAVTDLLGGNERAAENARRIKESVAAWDEAIKQFGASLERLDPYAQQLAQNAQQAEAFFDSLNASFGGITSLEDLPDRQTVIDTLNALAGLDSDIANEAREFWTRVLQIIDQAAANAEKIKESMQAAAEAAERARVADRFAEIEAGKESLGGIIAEIIRNGLKQAGNDRDLFEFDLNQWAEGLIEKLRQLRDAGVISNEWFAQLVATINGQVITALEDFDRAAKQSAAAALAAAKAEQFRQMVDLANLDLQILLAQGRDREALLLRQEIALMEAVNAGRSDEYIAKLKQLHAIQLANQALQEHNATLARQAEATREATRAADGFVRAIGLSGETLALYRNRALRYGGAGDPFGLSSSTPNFSAAPASSSVTMNIESGAIQISVAPGEDPRAVGDAVYEQVKERFRRDRLRGVPNPFGGL